MELREFVHKHGGLPLANRTLEEEKEDYRIENLCLDSIARSLERRGPKRVSWGSTIIVGELELSAYAIKSRRFSFEHIQEVLTTQRSQPAY